MSSLDRIYRVLISGCGVVSALLFGVVAVLVTLVQFLVNVIGQMWEAVAWLRPLTVFFYYQPQQIVLEGRWTANVGRQWATDLPPVNVIASSRPSTAWNAPT